MRFQVYFTRDQTTLGTDTTPTVSTGGPDETLDNVLSTKVGNIGNPIHRIAVGYWFSGGSGIGLPATLWAYDRRSEKWYKTATRTLVDGEISYFPIPHLADPPQVKANLGVPTAGGGQYMLVVADPTGGSLTTGTYGFVMGPDNANF